ncbi:hypothetical protein MUK42_05243 [Musa troglodytarum]|uniref:Uncharacterized protein n=1 Tax=Musa troglodytarum TaxID=320322 RepID=A0A9E7G5M6_9LILI|nr:hypothetical protein MUK42_05243 [Musa troglodytarum]
MAKQKRRIQENDSERERATTATWRSTYLSSSPSPPGGSDDPEPRSNGDNRGWIQGVKKTTPLALVSKLSSSSGIRHAQVVHGVPKQLHSPASPESCDPTHAARWKCTRRSAASPTSVIPIHGAPQTPKLKVSKREQEERQSPLWQRNRTQTTRPQCWRFGAHHQTLPSPSALADTINALLVMELADAPEKKTKDPCRLCSFAIHDLGYRANPCTVSRNKIGVKEEDEDID